MQLSFSYRHVLAVIMLILLLVPGFACAEELVVTPKIKAQTAYDDNVVFDGVGDFEFRATPSIKIKYGQEDWSVKGGGEAAILRYADLDNYDRENYKVWLEAEKELNEVLELNLDTSFDYDHTYLDELTESGTEATPTLRRKYSATPGMKWSPTLKDQFLFSLPFSEIKYAAKTNPDSVSFGGSVDWVHGFNDQQTSLLSRGSYTRLHYDLRDGDTDQDVFVLMGGAGYKPSELIDLKGFIGVTYAKTDVIWEDAASSSSNRVYFSFDLSGTYSLERWKFTIGADRQVSPSIYGESALRTRGKGAVEYSITKRFSTYLGAAYYQTDTDGLTSDSKTTTYFVRPWIKYNLSEDMTLRLEYKYTNIENRITDKIDEQNRIALRFEYEIPTFF